MLCYLGFMVHLFWKSCRSHEVQKNKMDMTKHQDDSPKLV